MLQELNQLKEENLELRNKGSDEDMSSLEHNSDKGKWKSMCSKNCHWTITINLNIGEHKNYKCGMIPLKKNSLSS